MGDGLELRRFQGNISRKPIFQGLDLIDREFGNAVLPQKNANSRNLQYLFLLCVREILIQILDDDWDAVALRQRFYSRLNRLTRFTPRSTNIDNGMGHLAGTL